MPKAARTNVGHKARKVKRGRVTAAVSNRSRAHRGAARSLASEELQTGRTRFEAVMEAAARSGLLRQKSSRIAGRVSPALVAQAKRQTGITADSDLIAFALANVALEEGFAEAFRKSRGKVPADVKLGF